MRSKIFIFLFVLILQIPSFLHASENTNKTDDHPLLRAAIFIQNNAGPKMDSQIDPLSSQLSARLTEKGFSIIDRRDVMAKFNESRHTDAGALKAALAIQQLLTTGKSDTRLEDALSGTSALRMAQMLRADYLIIASVNSLSTETRTFKGEGTVYGTNNQSSTYNLRMAIKVLEGGQGGSVYGDVITASERISVGENLVVVTDDIYPRLIDSAAVKLSDNISSKLEQIRKVNIAKPDNIPFSVHSNVEGATVELDGAVIGSTPGKFSASPGLHNMRITKEWLTNWERTVNIIPNQTIAVTLELSDEGLKRFITIEQFKTELQIVKNRAATENYVAKKRAEGEKKLLENSHIRYEGAPTTNIIH